MLPQHKELHDGAPTPIRIGFQLEKSAGPQLVDLSMQGTGD